MSRRRDALALFLAALAVACSRKPQREPAPAPVPSAATTSEPVAPPSIGGARPAELHVPSSYVRGRAAPLVMMLHAYGVNGAIEEWFFRLRSHADARGFLYVTPDGTPNGEGRRYWNATDACCAPHDLAAPPNDVEYLRELVGEIASKYDVDRKRVYVVGHSNGGFMAHRLACEHPDLFAAIVSVAGATFQDAARCKPSSPIAVLQIHGTADATIKYQGGAFFSRAYPGAEATAGRWAQLNGCSPKPAPGGALDLDGAVDGAETRVLRYDGCRAHAAVELWTIDGGSHVPLPTTDLAKQIVDFLYAHPKP